jgi:hypothetical protein
MVSGKSRFYARSGNGPIREVSVSSFRRAPGRQLVFRAKAIRRSKSEGGTPS